MTFMMKSCVIFTLQGANNIGAFLQAYGLMTVQKLETENRNIVVIT